MAPHLSPAGLRFLKGLERNNDRDWFNDRKSIFESEVQQPWLALLEAVNDAFATWAPAYVKPPKKAAMRIYRDIRFSADKRPYKTHMAAWWSPTTTERTSGGGFYVHAGAKGVVIAAGVYMPLPDQLLSIRRYLQQHHAQLRALLHDRKLRKLMPELDSNPLTRMPKGFAPDDPAADLLLCRQWAISASLPAEAALSADLLKQIVTRFHAALPLVELLNTPLLQKPAAKKSLF